MIVKSRKADVIAELKEQQKNETTSTLLLIDAESCHMKRPDECPDLLLSVVRLLNEGLVTNVVPIGKFYVLIAKRQVELNIWYSLFFSRFTYIYGQVLTRRCR